MKKINYKVVLSALMVSVLILTGCQTIPGMVKERTFIEFANDTGRELILMSPLNTSFTYGDLEEEGLKDYLFTMEMNTPEELETNIQTIERMYDDLKSFKRSELSDDEKKIYDMMKFQLDATMDSLDYTYYGNNFNPTFGLQIIMPLTLVQLELETKTEVDGFMARLELLPEFFDNAIAMEYEKAEMDLLLQPYLYDLTIEQIDELVITPDTFMLYQGFEEQMAEADFLSDEEKADYTEQCLTLIDEKLFPAYDRMKEALAEIRDMSDNELGTVEFEDGLEYYETLIYEKTSYKMTVEDMETFIIDKITERIEDIQTYIADHPEIASFFENGYEFPVLESTEEAFELSEALMEEKFYDYGVVSAKQDVIPSYLEEHMPSGFYFVTSMDLEDYGTMYLQESYYEEMDINAFTTLIHENIPGHHMYFSILYTQELPFIQQVSDWDAYSEGFAVYVQNYAFDVVVDEEVLSEYFRIFFDIQYLEDMYRDLNVHVNGMTREDYINELMSAGYDQDGAEDSYNRLITNPAEIYQYYFSYFKIQDYREAFEEAKGEDFDEKAFHDFILKHTNIPFKAMDDIVETYLEQ